MAGELVTLPWHVQWRGKVFGYPLSSMTLTNVTGWLSSPSPRSATVERPGRHGLFLGQLRAGGRIIECSFTLALHDYTALDQLRSVAYLEEDPQPEELVLWVGTDAPQLVKARLERWDIPTDYAFSVGDHRATLQWLAGDPLRYAVGEVTQQVGLPQPGGGGLEFPLLFPLDFGAAKGGASMTLTNSGTATVWPVWTLTGPMTGPVITNSGTGAQLLFESDWVLGAGEQVVIDTDARTVLLAGVSRRERLQRAQWFGLPPGTTTVQLTHSGSWDAAARLAVSYRHGYM